MKKSLLALAVLSAFAGVASAQSSVTISGSVDAGLRRVGVASTGTSTKYDTRFAGSQSGYNAITFSGVEDLGGGNRAFFSLNHRFAIGTGANNSPTQSAGSTDCDTATTGVQPCSDPFWRQAWVGVGSNSIGDVRLGRMLVPLQDFNGNFDPFLTGTVGSVHTGGISATIRANNAVYYRSPSLGGLVVHAMAATTEGQNQGVNGLGEIGANGAQGYFARTALLGTQRPIGFGARYTAGPIDVAVAYDRNSADLKTTGVYAAYNFGVLKLMGQFEKGDNCVSAATTCTSPGTTAITGQEDIKALSVGLTAPLGAFLLRTGYLRIDSDLASRDASKFGFGGDYNLSKRTNLYATVGKWRGDRISLANKKTQFDLGVTHRF